jgi:hypothetical protein
MSTANQPSSPPPHAVLAQLANGAFVSQALYVAAKLGVADLLADGPRPVGELAAETSTHAGALHRVLRTLASVGVFREAEPKVFALTPLAEPLRTDATDSVRNLMIFEGEAWHWRVIGNMLYSVQTGRPAWGRTLGLEVFEYFAANPDSAKVFNATMTELSVSAAPAIIEAYDYSQFGTLVDVAGGHGYLLAQLLKATPRLRGILFDMPQVLEGASALLEREGVANRVERVSGDFFASVPQGADAYLMKHIIHDWDDDRSVALLRNVRAAMPDTGRVLIVEMVVPEPAEPHPSLLLDLEMLVSPGGVERTAAEYGDLLATAGLRLSRIVPTRSPFSIVEAVKDGHQ